MRKLSVRKRGKKGQGCTAYEVGEAGTGPAVTVAARGKRDALLKAKPKLRKMFVLEADAAQARAATREQRRLEHLEEVRDRRRKGGAK